MIFQAKNILDGDAFMAQVAPKKHQNKFEKTLANGLEMAYLSPKMVNCDPTSSLHLVCYRYSPRSKGIFIVENYSKIFPPKRQYSL